MIQAKIVADSLAPNGARLTTLEIVFPRYILAELNTHRLFSKNSASSRAIPFNKMVNNVQENPFIPYAWQEEHSGMQGTSYIIDKQDIEHLKDMWLTSLHYAIQQSKALTNPQTYVNGKGLTKQLANRLLEPFMYHKVLVSGTEWENFFNLRCPKYQIRDCNAEYSKIFKSRKQLLGYFKEVDELYYSKLINYTILDWLKVNQGQADIHMMFLAEAIYDAMNESTPTKLKEGEWHIPYGDNMELELLETLVLKANYGWESGNQEEQGGWTIEGGEEAYYLEIKNTKCKISIARCARLSYQTLGDNPVIDYEKDLALYENLIKSGHASPTEHVARVMTNEEYKSYFRQEGFKAELGWCRNYKGFRQMRELIGL